jgi:Protein of unknown function (DUF4239)
MQNSGLLDPFPLWTLLPLTIAIALISVELGFRAAQYRKKHSAGEPEAPSAGMVGATLGLLAFMLAFTFGLAGSRFEARRQLVQTEANAISTTYLRADLLAEPMHTDAQSLLKEYVDARLAGTNPAKLAESISKSEEIQRRLWAQAVLAIQKEKSVVTSLFSQSVNQLIELHSQRITAGVRSRIPAAIWIGLYLVLILAMAAVGYQEGMASKRRSIAVITLVCGFSIVMFLITDLDRPGQGYLQINHEAMMDVKKVMQ